jgi:thioredoxin reductase (NADPH)
MSVGAATGPDAECDCAVIGGGPAGLAAALYLTRFRRSVRVFDDGLGRARTIPRSHNVPGFPDGINGKQLVAAMREQARLHGAVFHDARVESIEKLARGFAVRASDTRTTARLVLLATGASDVEPAMPHLLDAVRSGALRYCPVCDGYEVIDRAVGVITDSADGVREALYLRHYTPKLTLFVTSPDVRLDDAERLELSRAGIAIVDEPVTYIGTHDGGAAVRHGSAQTLCDCVYAALGMRVHSGLAVALGARHDDDAFLLTDRHQQTTVPGLYAAGDVSVGLNQIVVACGEAAIAASAMHLELQRDGA